MVALSTELTSKLYPGKAGAESYRNYVVFEANKMQFASLDKKIQFFKEVVLYSGATINEWRLACNMAPVPWGDEPVMRLDATGGANPLEENDNE